MAIIESLPHINATIEVEGQTATEFAPISDDGEHSSTVPSACRYIEAVSEKLFSILVTIGQQMPVSRERGLCIRVSVDGHSATGRAVSTHSNLANDSPSTFRMSGMMATSAASGELVEKQFMFAPVLAGIRILESHNVRPSSNQGANIVEDSHRERVDRDVRTSKGLGQITVRIYSCRVGQRSKSLGYSRLGYSPVNEVSHLAEKAIKGRELTHGTSYSHGHELPLAGATTQVHDEVLMCEFLFKYRSKDALRREMIIPSSPGPSETDELDRFSSDEIRRLARQMLRTSQEVKQEDETFTPSRKRTRDLTDEDVQEISSRSRFRAVKLESGEDSVDLTGDD